MFWYGFANGLAGLLWVAGGVFAFTFCLLLLSFVLVLVLLDWIVAFWG